MSITIIMHYVPYIIVRAILLHDWQRSRFVYTCISTDTWVMSNDSYDITRQSEFFSFIIALWDHRCLCRLSSTETLLCGTRLYMSVYNVCDKGPYLENTKNFHNSIKGCTTQVFEMSWRYEETLHLRRYMHGWEAYEMCNITAPHTDQNDPN